MEYWTTEGLSTISSGVGKPLYSDAITRACTRLDFARVCMMLDVTKKMTKHIIIMTLDEDGGETPCKIDVEYEWLPPKCTSCMTIGHMAKDCALNKALKPTKPPVAVTGIGVARNEESELDMEHNVRPPPMHDQMRMPSTQGVDNRREGRELPCERRLSREEKAITSCVNLLWKKSNLRRLKHTEGTPTTMALVIVEDIR
ncbi:UNVERIFIED_CONTAM: hypothetical protein Sindi_0057400 [Sesamum indicum]